MPLSAALFAEMYPRGRPTIWSLMDLTQTTSIADGTREEILGTEAVWQTPPGTAKGLLFLAHGCNHGATFSEAEALCAAAHMRPEMKPGRMTRG